MLFPWGCRRRGADIEASRLTAGVPEDLAERAGVWPLLHTGFDLVEVAGAHGRNVAEAAVVEWNIFDRLDLMWLWDAIGDLPRSDRWETQARSAVRDDLLTALTELTRTVIESAGGSIVLDTDRIYLPGQAEGTADPRRLGLRLFEIQVSPAAR